MRHGVLMLALLAALLIAPAAFGSCLSWTLDLNCFCLDKPDCSCLPTGARAGMSCNVLGCGCAPCSNKELSCADSDTTATDARFIEIDRTRDGKLSTKEVERWVKKEVPETVLKSIDLKKAFEQMDKNKDGFIDRAEFDPAPTPAP
ncbi:MAG TPA: EF-hand domain-containing protein [Thermoanaerobaculia bacterium]|nr:EF-hand domain-containing protein [Thermoanaerobaculia bacterium]